MTNPRTTLPEPHFGRAFNDSQRPGWQNANESALDRHRRDIADDAAVASSFGNGDLMNVAVRMVVPIRREFGRQLDVTHFLHDATYARGIVNLAKNSRDARLRGYAVFLETRLGLVPTVQVLAEPAARHRAAPTAAATAQGGAAAQLAFQEARKLCARQLTDALGPSATPMCLKIEAASTPEELIAAAQRAHAVVREVRGAAQAQRFAVAVESRLKALVG